MNTATIWRSGVISDLGLRRTTNEDRVFADDARGIFLVVDGLGGHAAGEVAAETAVHVIEERMRSFDLEGEAEAPIREAIANANNRICDLARSHSEWQGMACVLTLAVVQEDRLTIGHVGDSRLYLMRDGHLEKLTSDHSPVGEQEDRGLLSETDAMKHPRRNEIFRDVGTRLRAPHDPEFIEIKRFTFYPDGALLLCSDGLSDVLTSEEIAAIVEKYDGAPHQVAEDLIEAANQAGGKDNVSVIFVPGPEFLGSKSQQLIEARPRHAITRPRDEESRWRSILRNVLWLFAGTVLGLVIGSALYQATRPAKQTQAPKVFRRAPLVVNSADSHGIQKALETALPGDTIEVSAGEYLGPLQLKDHVEVIGKAPAQVTLRTDPFTATDAGIAVIARGARNARIEGFRIIADKTHVLRIGVWITNSSVEVTDVEIAGAIEAGIRIDGSSEPKLLANFIHANSGPGVWIKDDGAPWLAGNWISENGRAPNNLHAGIEVDPRARPRFGKNSVIRNGTVNRLVGDSPGEKSK